MDFSCERKKWSFQFPFALTFSMRCTVGHDTYRTNRDDIILGRARWV